MYQTALYKEGTRIPLGDGAIILHCVKNRDEKHIHVYRKRTETGEDLLCMAYGAEHGAEIRRRAVTGWLREYARARLGEKVRIYAGKMQVTVNRIAIKEQKTRWGSCSSKGNLNFNWKLVLMPERIQDYVVVHELAHRKQMNHSKEFWNEVFLVLPDYQESRVWLREHEGEFLKY